MQLYYLILVLFLTWQNGLDTGLHKTNTQKPKPGLTVASNLSYRVTSSPNGTFGYIIYQNTTPLIRQETIPGMHGNFGFRKPSDAEKVAKAVVLKIQNGEFPPSISIGGLKELGVIE